MDTPTIYDVSRLSGVSTATVSRTFTSPDRVREETRRKVYAAAEALAALVSDDELCEDFIMPEPFDPRAVEAVAAAVAGAVQG